MVILKTRYRFSKTTYFHNAIRNFSITKLEIQRAILKSKNNEAPGIDSIPAEFYKYADRLQDEFLSELYNYICDED